MTDKTLREEIIMFLAKHGPLTSADIAQDIGKPYASVRRAIAAARKGKTRAFYIDDYDDVAGDGYKRPAMYAVGNKPDAPYPHIGTEQKYKRQWQREKTKRLIRQLGTENPFSSLIVQVTK